MKYIVYQITNKENGKIYIGVHKTINPDTFDGYIGNGIYVGYSLENPKTAFQYALKKYGYNSFIRTTLFIYDNEQDAYDKEAQIVTLKFIKNDNNYNIKTGGIHGAWNFKVMYQFNYNGDLIKSWDSISDIIEYYNCNPSRFHMAAIDKYSAFESYWSYENQINIEEYRKSKHSELYQFDFTGNLLKVFKNSVQAIQELNLSKDSLNEAVSKKKIYKESFWTKDPDNIQNIIKINRLFNLRNRPVIVYDNNKNYINEYIGLQSASDNLNIPYGTIKSGITKGSLVKNLYYFSYEKLDKFIPYKGNIIKNKKIGQYDYNTGKLVKVWNTITECAKIHPKCRDVIKGGRNHTHGYTFKYIDD